MNGVNQEHRSLIRVMRSPSDSSLSQQHEGAVRHIPAELLGVLQILGEMRVVDEQLLGHAAAYHAGAANPIFFRHPDPHAMHRGHAGGTDPA